MNPERIRKSISVEETYLQDLPDVGTCIAALLELMTRLEGCIERADPLGIHNLFVKLKFSDFQQTTVELVHERLDVPVFSQLIHEGSVAKN